MYQLDIFDTCDLKDEDKMTKIKAKKPSVQKTTWVFSDTYT